jgi:purine-binding chemotaxis protein CheW
MKQLVSFFLEDQLFGIDIQLAREVNPDTNIIPVPLSRKEICGLVNIRGQVIMVVNLSVLLGMPPRLLTSESHIIILKTTQEYVRVRNRDTSIHAEIFGDKPIGLLVDKIGDVVSVIERDIEPPPQHLDESRSSFFEGVTRGKPLLSIVNVEALLSVLYKSTEENIVIENK